MHNKNFHLSFISLNLTYRFEFELSLCEMTRGVVRLKAKSPILLVYFSLLRRITDL